MFEVEPDTRTRLSLDELSGVSFHGDPSSVAVRRMSDGSEVDSVRVERVPERLECEWEVSGVTVSAVIDVVSRPYCTLADIKDYRTDEYQNGTASDSAVLSARQRAIEVIEHECGRFLQPVLGIGFVDRPSCRTTTIPIVDGSMAADIASVVRAEYSDGSPAPVSAAGGSCVSVAGMPCGSSAVAVLDMGLRSVPEEMRGAVTALAASYLVPKAGPENATSQATDVGVLNFIVAGVNGAATSVPDVNAVIQRYGLSKQIVG